MPALSRSLVELFGRQQSIECVATGCLADRKARKSGLVPVLALEIVRARFCLIFAFLESWGEPFFRCRRVIVIVFHGLVKT